MRWVCPVPNGWWPRLSDDGAFVSHGAGECFVTPIGPDAVPLSLGPGFAGRWIKGWLLFHADGQKRTLALYNPRTGERKAVALAPDLAEANDLDANDGIFVLSLRRPGRILRCTLDPEAAAPVPVDVTVLCESGGLEALTAGGFVASNFLLHPETGTYGVRRWAPDGTVKDVIRSDANEVTVSSTGEVGFGYYGPVLFLSAKDNSVWDGSGTPWRRETPPCFVAAGSRLWLVTGTEDPAIVDPADPLARPLIIARPVTPGLYGGSGGGVTPVSSPGCLYFDRQPPLHPHARRVGDELLVAGHDANGRLVVQSQPLEPLWPFPIDRRPPMPPAWTRFRVDRTEGAAPLEVVAERLEERNVLTRRWQVGARDLEVLPNAPTPNAGETYRYRFTEPGDYDVDLKVQGVLADEAHLPGTGGLITFAGRQTIMVRPPAPQPEPEPEPQPPDPRFRTGFRGIQMGFGQPLVTPDYNPYVEMKARNLEAARIGAAYRTGGTFEDRAEMAQLMVREVLDAGLRPIVVCRTLQNLQDVPPYIDIGWQNEPEGIVDHKWTPAEYALSIPEVMAICRRRHLFPWFGENGNLDPDPLAWLAQIMPWVPEDAGVSVHWYPGKNGLPYPPALEKVQAFKALVGTRRIALTETGFNTGPWSEWRLAWRWPPIYRVTCRLLDLEVAKRTKAVFEFFRAQGFEVCIGYQRMDGLGENALDRFGWQLADGRTWKILGNIYLPGWSG